MSERMGLTREQMAARAAAEPARRRLREPRHRPADAGAEPRAGRRRAWCCRARTASSASGRTRTRATRTPTW
nr:hypothetical protein [Angustibacter aerolatus]